MKRRFSGGACALTLAVFLCVQETALAQDAPHRMAMAGMYGDYPMTREASGTAWQPDSTPRDGVHVMSDGWIAMLHGYVDAVVDDQGGPRGERKEFSESMLMAGAQRELGPGTIGLRSMLSLDPLMGKDGYPLLFGSGETANGVTPLVDRQHPHNLFMELAGTYSLPLGEQASAFAYVADPGEPALGPPVFMHRFSGMDNPEAPITHHWFDSTHTSFGVATLGGTWQEFKFEGSAFHGREPDQFRYRFETGSLDSGSARLTWNPTEELSLQLSRGHLVSPEELMPGISDRRTTATLIYQTTLLNSVDWGTTMGWGQNDFSNRVSTSAWLLESAAKLRETTVFGRLENLANDEHFEPPSLLSGDSFRVTKLTVGAIDDFVHVDRLAIGVGGLVSRYAHPAAMDPAYGHPTSFMLFARVKIASGM